MTAVALPEVWVVDSSPLIVLAKIGRLNLLAVADRRVIVVGAVAEEIECGTERDPARLALSQGWGERLPIPADLATWGLDAGEEATLAAALLKRKYWPFSMTGMVAEQRRHSASRTSERSASFCERVTQGLSLPQSRFSRICAARAYTCLQTVP